MGRQKRSMDERQLWVRGNIFQHMVLLTAVLLLANAFVQDYYGSWASGRYESVIILMAVVAAGSVEMVAKDAYFIVGNGHKWVVWLMAACAVFLLGMNIFHLAVQHRPLLENGMLGEPLASIILALAFLATPLAALVKKIADRGDEDPGAA